MVRAGFFDLDGTLMDHRGADDAAVVRLLAHRGHAGLRAGEVVDLWRRLEDEHWDAT